MQQVRTVLKKQFEVVFGIKLIETTRDNLASILDHSTLKAGV
jgi:hypothetical protein